jgi:hypothetical protein
MQPSKEGVRVEVLAGGVLVRILVILGPSWVNLVLRSFFFSLFLRRLSRLMWETGCVVSGSRVDLASMSHDLLQVQLALVRPLLELNGGM